ncbi:hypothetical protein QBZ16_004016 [Prototheca wickerhamii]|uniref:Cytochrome b5 heme-binding domain-containing protein n=1 Tax=Prototheca wickerhamii TaxID=3111 RepID=A0AAD9IIG0_PROWI|nr:hypothetical protein QBZ16_004016 [Prototheca wickerhamii]
MAEESTAPVKSFSLEDVAPHSSEKDCWLVIHGKVYDVTQFLDEHPGGYDIVVSNSGKDSTEDFDEIGHSKTAQDMLKDYYIGEFKGGSLPAKVKKQAVNGAVAPVAGTSLPLTLVRALLPLLILAFAIYYALR